MVLAVESLSSAHAKTTLQIAQTVLPIPVARVLTDNGAEFARHPQALRAAGLRPWRTYPKTPKRNARAESFNHTVQVEFVDYHEDLLFCDLTGSNDKLFDWLLWYNAQYRTLISADTSVR